MELFWLALIAGTLILTFRPSARYRRALKREIRRWYGHDPYPYDGDFRVSANLMRKQGLSPREARIVMVETIEHGPIAGMRRQGEIISGESLGGRQRAEEGNQRPEEDDLSLKALQIGARYRETRDDALRSFAGDSELIDDADLKFQVSALVLHGILHGIASDPDSMRSEQNTRRLIKALMTTSEPFGRLIDHSEANYDVINASGGSFDTISDEIGRRFAELVHAPWLPDIASWASQAYKSTFAFGRRLSEAFD